MLPVERTRVADESVGDVLGRLVADAKAYASAEVAAGKALVSSRSGDAGMAAGLAGGAVVLALSSVTALLVGFILSLATLIGPLGATFVVVIVTLIVAAILAKLAMARLKRVTAAPGAVE